MKKIVLVTILAFLIWLLPQGCGQDLQGERVSFAVIADPHIGYDIPDYYPEYSKYGEYPWFDDMVGEPGGNDRSAINMKKAVDKIIFEKDKYGIKFVVVVGDISDTAERTEFLRFRESVKELNDKGIACLFIVGNHDTYSYTQPAENFNPNERSLHADIDWMAQGDKIFEDVLWHNDKNMKLIKNIFGSSWEKQEVPLKVEGVNHIVYLSNWGGSWGGFNFIGLDLAPRDEKSILASAYPGEVSLKAALHKPTIDFSSAYSAKHKAEKRIAFLFSHYPLGAVEGYRKFIDSELYDQVYSFTGHWHKTDEKYFNFKTEAREILTEDLAGIDTFPGYKRQNLPLRIVTMDEHGTIDYSTLLSLEFTGGTFNNFEGWEKSATKIRTPKPPELQEIYVGFSAWMRKLYPYYADVSYNRFVVAGNEVWTTATIRGVSAGGIFYDPKNERNYIFHSADLGKTWEIVWEERPQGIEKITDIIGKDSLNIAAKLDYGWSQQKREYIYKTVVTQNGGVTWIVTDGWNKNMYK